MPGHQNFTMNGQGGNSGVWWIDNAGGVPWANLAAYNFNLLPNSGGAFNGTMTGSTLLSSPFKMQPNQTLTVVANVLAAHDFPIYDVGFAVLLHNSAVSRVLFAMRPDGITHFLDVGNIQASSFAAPSAGVTLYTGPGPVAVVLSGVTYAQPNTPGGGNSTGVTAVCTPGAGDYQLLFGCFAGNGLPNQAKPAALIVEFATLS